MAPRFVVCTLVTLLAPSLAWVPSVGLSSPAQNECRSGATTISTRQRLLTQRAITGRSVSSLDASSTSSPPPSNLETLKQIKIDLIQACKSSSSNNKADSNGKVRSIVEQLEPLAEQLGIGQASSLSGLISGDWDLLYASEEDDTRSSPFFWAFRRAFPDSADQIYQITDAIPSPLKDIGPAWQKIQFNEDTRTGQFVSQVKVATLGGAATSLMTTRASITGIEGVDGLKLQIETTKPEDSTIVKTMFGPFGDVINSNAPAFPSGQALESIQRGSSSVVLRTTFCDEGLRISRNTDDPESVFVFRRRNFTSYDYL